MNLFSAIWPSSGQPVMPPPGQFTSPSLAGKLSGNPSRPARQQPRQAGRQPSPHYALAMALRDAGRPLTITELAAAMGVSVGESSKRVKAAREIVRTKRVGRCKLVRLKTMSWPEWRDLFEGRPS